MLARERPPYLHLPDYRINADVYAVVRIGLIYCPSECGTHVELLNSYPEQLRLHHLHVLSLSFITLVLLFSALIPSYINTLPLVTSAPLAKSIRRLMFSIM